ncbi:MAG: hypothetical protein WEB37_06580, partial [Bacteroidota bacterium]
MELGICGFEFIFSGVVVPFRRERSERAGTSLPASYESKRQAGIPPEVIQLVAELSPAKKRRDFVRLRRTQLGLCE